MYNPKANYCSFAPDKLFGVKFNYACYLHDRQYRNEVKKRKTRLKADQDLRDYIYHQFIISDQMVTGWLVSKIYYLAVRLFSWRYWVNG